MSLFSDHSLVVPPQAGCYQVIYIDAPWPERGGGKVKRGADRHYSLMKVDDIIALPVDEWAAPDAHKRIEANSGATQERNQALTVLLRRVEQFRGVGLAATNTKDALDSAMWRRFGLQISVDLPGEAERFAILRKYALPFDLDDAAIDILVDATRNCSPSLLRQLMEGVKRALVLAPKLHHLDIDRPDIVFGHVIGSIAPPPEMERPPLWANSRAALTELKKIAWPPARNGSAAK